MDLNSYTRKGSNYWVIAKFTSEADTTIFIWIARVNHNSFRSKAKKWTHCNAAGPFIEYSWKP